MTGSILVVDDHVPTAELLCEMMRRRGFEADAVDSGRACLEHLQRAAVDVVVTDIQMAGMSGLELCANLRESHPDLLPIVITGKSTLATAIAAIRAGAYDFITKPVDTDAIEAAVWRAFQHLSLKREVVRMRGAVRDAPLEGIAGRSPAIREMVELIQRVATTDASVLITGESGTGKELVARAIHRSSPNRDRPFVAVNCAAMPSALLESELFGHVRGAFTDAKHDRKGLFLQAEGGTILLDEIGDMPSEMQVKLLRVLQQRTVRPVGGDQETPFDVRVVTSTNRNLDELVAEKQFRVDLFYRINVVQITVPPLRERAGDILVLAQHFIEQFAARSQKPVKGVAPAAARLLVDFDWPGNVRELENVIERAVALCRLDEITVVDLPSRVRNHTSTRMLDSTDSVTELVTMEEMERRYARQVLKASRGNKTLAARVLGMDRRSLYRRLRDPDPVLVPDTDVERSP